MSAELTYTHLLQDEQMLTHLEKGDTLFFNGLGHEWLNIERQVERLVGEDLYIISQRGLKGGSVKVSPVKFR